MSVTGRDVEECDARGIVTIVLTIVESGGVCCEDWDGLQVKVASGDVCGSLVDNSIN